MDDEKSRYKTLCRMADSEVLTGFEKAHLVYMAVVNRWSSKTMVEKKNKLVEWKIDNLEEEYNKKEKRKAE